jgi:hypothetical protein
LIAFQSPSLKTWKTNGWFISRFVPDIKIPMFQRAHQWPNSFLITQSDLETRTDFQTPDTILRVVKLKKLLPAIRMEFCAFTAAARLCTIIPTSAIFAYFYSRLFYGDC